MATFPICRILPYWPAKAKRQTLLFSATMSDSIARLRKMASSASEKEACLFELTKERPTPVQLKQEYLFMPAQVKTCYMVQVMGNVHLFNLK